MALNEDVQQVQPRSMDEIERRASRITRHESRLFPRRAVVPSPEATAARITVFMVFPKHESRDTCLPTRQANHGFPAFSTEALQSCFGRPGRRSMTTGRLEIALPSPLGARTKEKSLPASHPCPREGKSEEKSEEKSGEKNRGGDITPMRLRRSLFFVAPATAAGRPSRRTPGETVQALPGRPGRPGCGLPGAPKLPQDAAPEARSYCRTKLHRMRGRCGRTSFGPGASRARLGRKSGVGRAVRLAVGAQGSHHQKPPPGPPRQPPSQRFPAHFCPELPGIARNCSARGGPEQVSAHRPPFSVGLTTRAVRRSPRRPPGCYRCRERKMNP